MVHSENFIKLSFEVVSHKNIFGEAVLRPLACCAQGQLSPSALPISYATARGVECTHCVLTTMFIEVYCNTAAETCNIIAIRRTDETKSYIRTKVKAAII